MGNCCQPSDNNALFITSENDNHHPTKKDQNSDNLGVFRTPTNLISHPSDNNILEDTQNELNKMEDEFLDLINNLREYPQQFISLIEKYKYLISVDPQKRTYFIVINNTRIDLNQGQEYFIECQNFLKNAKSQKKLIRDDTLKIPRPSQPLSDEENDDYVNQFINNNIVGKIISGYSYTNINYIIDQNVSDILFVLILNLIGVGGTEQIRKNFMLSDEYDSIGITIDKIDPENNIYCYYCVFAKAMAE